MREILFRGKITQDEWVYGFYENVKLEEATIHYINGKIVIPETVGQFTGLTDKNGTKVFEGDIVEVYDYKKYIVKFDKNRGGYFPFAQGDGCGCCENDTYYVGFCEVIGNIYDNPELLER